MTKENSGMLSIEDRNLAVMLKKAHEIAEDKRIGEIEFGNIIESFAKFVFAIYEKDRAKNEEKQDNRGLLEKMIDKINPFKKAKDKKGKLTEDQAIKEIKNELFIAIAQLRSANSVDSLENDLNITRKLAVVASIATNCKVPSGVAEEARLAVGRVSNTSGNSVNSIGLSAGVQSLRVSSVGTSKALRYNLEGNTDEVPLGQLPITDAAKTRKEIENERFLQESRSLPKSDTKSGG